jgi:hypothetical protein
MGTFEQYGTHSGFKCDFDLYAWPVEAAWQDWTGWDGKRFGDQLWSDVGLALGIATGSCPGERDDRVLGVHRYRFDDEDVTLTLCVEDPWPGDACATGRVRLDVLSHQDEAGDVAERIYEWLDATGRYRVTAREVTGMRVAANFEVPETD